MVAAALEVSGLTASTPDHAKKLTESAKLSEHNRQLDLHLAAISRIQQRWIIITSLFIHIQEYTIF